MTAIIPRTSLTIRPAVAGDLQFIDRLQQMHSKAVGFMPAQQLEQKIARGEVLVAETRNAERGMQNEEGTSDASSSFCIPHSSFSVSPLGYCIASDRYFKRDEVGIIYQMNISPGAQRKLVAAMLLKEVFERAAYGCKLFCCWCAQDLEANYFWQSMGFVPIAFRTGAAGKKVRTHIFWQRRIRAGDETTPFWYPCKTDGGSMRQDRLVLPIPPHVRWDDAMPVLLPGMSDQPKALGGARQRKPKAAAPLRPSSISAGGLRAICAEQAAPAIEQKREPRRKVKNDPKHVAAARELRDRYLEKFNAGLVLSSAKYEVSKAIAAKPAPKLLPQAA